MTITKLVAFGCSWAFGDELIDPKLKEINSNAHACDSENTNYRTKHCYAGLVADHYGLELDNIAFNGSSLESMRWNLVWYLQNNPTNDVIFLVGLTNATRTSWFNPTHSSNDSDPPWNRHIHGAWLNSPNPNINENWYALHRTWLGMSYHRDWAEFNFVQTIDQFDHANSRRNIPVVQFNNLRNDYAATCPTLINPKSNFNSLLMQKQTQTNENYFAPNKHPNEQGHRIISDYLIKHIDSSKILEC